MQIFSGGGQNAFSAATRGDMGWTDCFVSPLVTNGLSHPYHLDESIFLFFIFFFFWGGGGGIRSNVSFLFLLSIKFMLANRIGPAFCGVTSGAILFVFVPRKGRNAYFAMFILICCRGRALSNVFRTSCCFHCKDVENETHFLLECPFYADMKRKLFQKANLCNTDFDAFSFINKVIF